MRNSLAIGVGLAFFLLTGAASAAKIGFSGELETGNEVTPVNPGDHEPRGWVEATFDDQSKRLCGQFIWEDLTGKPNGIHVHQAPMGMPNADGTVKFIIPVPAAATATDGVVKFNIVLDAAFATSLVTTEVYGNIHTDLNTKGEIRSTLFRNDELEEQQCGDPTPQDAGAPPTDASSQLPPVGTSGGTSNGGTDDTPSGSDEGNGAEAASTKPPPKDEGGCSTSGGAGDALGLGLAAGLALVAVASRRRRTRDSAE
jgi:MYXO-CTERM domain-containing protein